MKKMKNLLSFVLALVMVMAMGLTAMASEVDSADENLPGEIEDSSVDVYTNHTYKAYQIFSGTQSNETGAALGNVEWGSDVKGKETKIINALATVNSKFADCKTAKDVAKLLEENGSDATVALAVAKALYGVLAEDGLPTGGTSVSPNDKGVVNDTSLVGYYLIIDETNFESDPENAVRNLALLQLTGKGSFVIKRKTDIPTVEKKVDDINDSDASENTKNWQDSADYDVNDAVPFQLKGTLPQDYERYETYTFTFHDKQSNGLRFNPNSVAITVNGNAIQGGYKVITDDLNDECTFEIVIEDVKKLIVAGNYKIKNGDDIVVNYTSTLTSEAIIGSTGNTNKVYLEYSNNPNGTGNGKTPEDKVTVFTFELDVEKVEKLEGDLVPLAGAQFTLEKWTAGDNSETLDVDEEGYWKEISVLNSPEATDPGTKMLFKFERIDAGKYRLSETKTPAGYNTIDPIYFVVEAVHLDGENPELTSLIFKQTDESWNNPTEVTANFSVNVSTGVSDTQIENQKGVVLPETGGIGTTIFYVAGVILVIVAGVLLVTKKRMSKEQ